MKVHLIPSEELDDELYNRVLSLLQAIPGVNKFISNTSGGIRISEDFREEPANPGFPRIRKVVSWADLFSEIQRKRESYRIPDGEFVILLTSAANEKNWFSMLDENSPYNGFIHTDEWEHYMSCDPAIPIAYEVVALTLQKHIFTSYADIELLTHASAIGCVSDLCMKKTDIILKMRTADICPDCLSRVQSKLSITEIDHIISVLESLRIKMLYSQNFRQSSPPSRLQIGRGARLLLIDYESIEIRMHAMEKALYLLFLQYPEGIYLSSLADHRGELREIYSRISTRGMLEDMNRRIDEMTDVTRDQISSKISKIKKAFTDAIGTSLAEQYIIQGPNNEKKKIKLDRKLVIGNR